MKQTTWKYRFLMILGSLIYIGSALLSKRSSANALFLPLAFLGLMAGWLLANHSWEMNKKLHMNKTQRIEEEDERNVAVNNRAKAKSFDILSKLLFALALGLSLNDLRIPPAIIVWVIALLPPLLNWWYRWKFDQEM